MAAVGVIANPASGRDIRRLVTGASVFDNAEKGSMVYRLLTGLGAVGIEKVWMMPAGEGLSGSLVRRQRSHASRPHGGDTRLPGLEFLDMPMRGDARDTTTATQVLVDAGVRVIVVLGGDGTHRAVAKECGDTPLCALSTGTNNAFPEMREATVAGLAAGLVASGRLSGDGLVRRHKRLDIAVDGRSDVALVDIAATHDRFVGARALWDVDRLGDAFVTFADPAAVGLAGIAGHVMPVPRAGERGLRLRLGPPATADTVVTVALAPGLIARVGVSDVHPIVSGETVHIEPADGCLAIDGEREIERQESDEITVTLAPGPLVLDVDAVMAQAAAQHVLRGPITTHEGGR